MTNVVMSIFNEIRCERKRKYIVLMCAVLDLPELGGDKKFCVEGRQPNRDDVDYDIVVKKILKLKYNSPKFFKRLYRLHPDDFDKVLEIITPSLLPKRKNSKHIVPPIISLCLGLRFLAGGSYLDMAFGYEVPAEHIHYYTWKALTNINNLIAPLVSLFMKVHFSFHAMFCLAASLPHGFNVS